MEKIKDQYMIFLKIMSARQKFIQSKDRKR